MQEHCIAPGPWIQAKRCGIEELLARKRGCPFSSILYHTPENQPTREATPEAFVRQPHSSTARHKATLNQVSLVLELNKPLIPWNGTLGVVFLCNQTRAGTLWWAPYKMLYRKCNFSSLSQFRKCWQAISERLQCNSCICQQDVQMLWQPLSEKHESAKLSKILKI